MSSVDNRIVNMKFENAAFEKGVSTTISSLDKLKQSLAFKDATNGLAAVQSTADKFHLGGIEGAVTGISKSFLAMSTIAITALSNITSKAISAGGSIAKSLTIDPLASGFNEFELKMGAIQTIMAGSGKSLETVNKYLQELNEYSDQTIYSFKDMTSNIGKFTNAGVSLKDSVASIKGVANVAALSGANAEEASRAMYNFAQALSSGSVKLQDWKSIELANMGTKEFKQQLIDSAVAAGTLEKTVGGAYKTIKGTPVSAVKGFNESLSEGWLTTEALTETLGRYSDETTDVGKRATAAATEVKTFTQMLDTLKESAGSGWAQTWELLFGNFEEGKKLWTGLNDFFGGFIKDSADARNAVLADWKELDGRTNLIAGIKNVFGALGDVLRPIKEAFRDIFPAVTGERLAELTKNFSDFAAKLRLGTDTIDKIKRTFSGLFAVLSIIKQVVSGAIGAVATALGALFGAGSGVGGQLLTISANVGDFLTNIDAMLKRSGAIKNFFDSIGTAVAGAINFIRDIAGAIGAMFSGQNTAFLDELISRFADLGPIVEDIQAKIQGFVDTIDSLLGQLNLGDIFDFGSDVDGSIAKVDKLGTSLSSTTGILERIQETASNIWDGIKVVFEKIKAGVTSLIEGFTLEEALALINTGFFIMLYNTLRQFVGKLGGLVDSFSGMYESVGGVLNQVTANLKTMQADVRSDILLKIAGALALLSVAIFVLSKVDTGDLAKSLSAIAIMLTMLVVAVKALEKATSMSGAANLAILSVGLIGMAVALTIMAGAIALFGNMDTGTLIKGMTSVAVIIGIVIAASTILSKTGGAGSLLVAAAALIILSVALTAFAGALKLYSALDTSNMLEGGIKIAAAIAVIALTMRLMPKNILAGAAGLYIIAAALVLLSGALMLMGSMSGGAMAKSLIMLGGSLLIIAIALNAMSGAIAGAAAILLFAVALNMMVPPLIVLSKMSLKEIGIALLALAGVFTVLGLAALILTPVLPMLFLLAQAIMMLGLGAMLAGAGLFLFATGLGVLATVGAAGAAVLIGIIITIIELFPLIMQQIGLGIIAFAKVISDGTPLMLAAFGKMLDATLKFIIAYAPKLYNTAFTLLEEFLKAAKKRMPSILEAGGDLIVAFVKGIGAQYTKIINAAIETLLKFLEGIKKAIDDNAAAFGKAGGDIAVAIIKGMATGITAGIGTIISAVTDMANNALRAAKDALGIDSPSKEFYDVGINTGRGMALGVDDSSARVDDSVTAMGKSAVETMKITMKDMANAINMDIELQPVIAPVLDLTDFRQSAARIQSMLAVRPVSAGVSFDQAAAISSTSQPVPNGISNSAQGDNSQIIFEQNNYSPKALSAIEIYRSTRNQISMAKEVLAG